MQQLQQTFIHIIHIQNVAFFCDFQHTFLGMQKNVWQEKRSFLWSIRTFANLILTFAQKLLKMSFSTSQVIGTFLKEGIVKNYFFMYFHKYTEIRKTPG